MAEARERSEWGRLSVLLALVANAHRDPAKHTALRPEQFNPYADKGRFDGLTRKRRPKAPLSILKDVFCRKTQSKTGLSRENIQGR